jgi:recombination protein RecA
MVDLGFLKDFEKDLSKAGMEAGSAAPPAYYHSSGNYVLNRIMSGQFSKGLAAQGRVTGLAGPSGAGKSFIAGNLMREAQRDGAYLLVLDSENALDSEFVSKIGVDTTQGFSYYDPITIPQVTKIISSFITKYKKAGATDKVHITIDSLDMLLTETEESHYEKGDTKGDQGQRNKQIKAMLRTFVQSIKNTNISMVITSQVYRNQDVTNGEGVWVVSDAVKYSLSQICLLTKLKLKDKATNETSGIRMKVEGYKTRFTQPFQTAVIEVPYETGMDPYNGLFDVAKGLGIIDQRGAWCYVGDDIKWQGAKLPSEHAKMILDMCEKNTETFIAAVTDDAEVEAPDTADSVKKQRKSKFDESAE